MDMYEYISEKRAYNQLDYKYYDMEGVVELLNEYERKLEYLRKRKIQSETTIKELIYTIIDYRKKQNLDKYDTIINLIIAVCVESGELLENINFNRYNREGVLMELADVFIYAFALANHMQVDIEEIIQNKIEYNLERGRKYD